MSSILIDELASPGIVLISERSDQTEYQGEVFTIYRGARTLTVDPWKRALSSIMSTRGTLPTEVSDSIFHSIESRFKDQLSSIDGIERVFIRKDDDFFRIWLVIPAMDLAIEDRIYAAQLSFMDRFPDIRFDFTIIFRQGKDPASIRPQGARLV